MLKIIKKKIRYTRLAEKPIHKNIDSKADVIIFAQTPDQLASLLESLKNQVTGVGQIFVMYKPTSSYDAETYQNIMSSYPEIEFYFIDQHRSNFKEILSALYQKVRN